MRERIGKVFLLQSYDYSVVVAGILMQEAHTALSLKHAVQHGGEDRSAKRQSLQPQDADPPDCTTHDATPMA